MVAEIQESDNQVVWLSRSEEENFFDKQARTLLGMSGDNCRSLLDEGAFVDIIDDPDYSDYLYLALLAGVAR